MTHSSDERGAEMRELFFETAQELLQSLNDEALKLEKHPGDAEVVRSIRRTVHTLKGDAAACGFRELSELGARIGRCAGARDRISHWPSGRGRFRRRRHFRRHAGCLSRKGKLPSTEPWRK